MKYRKKPVVVEAQQWQLGVEHPAVCTASRTAGPHPLGPHIHTLEGPLHVSPGDWIITGVKGEHYPCKPDVFAATYEPADEMAP